MIANVSQPDRTVRGVPDSHPNRPSRPVPSRPFVGHPSINLTTARGEKRMGGYAARFGAVR